LIKIMTLSAESAHPHLGQITNLNLKQRSI
jgi:hypothetical protein